MADPYLMAMMGGNSEKKTEGAIATEKDRFDLIINKDIEEYLDTIDFEAEIGDNKMQTPRMKRDQLREELQKSLQMTELDQNITTAFLVLVHEGKENLNPDEYQAMIDELLQIGDKINGMSFDSLPEVNLQTLFNISAPTMRAIFKVATAQFVNGRLDNCSALFMMLTALNPGHPEYWLRSGMAAHQSNNIDLALRSYRSATELDPQMVAAPLLLADCYLRLGNKDEAKEAFNKAKSLASSQEIDPAWKDLLNALAASLT